ncbi:hypothetical protein IID22_04965 [Patescibacteria group bacterium]|nr:hypothetical protein [Patescibacteria group bacterium]
MKEFRVQLNRRGEKSFKQLFIRKGTSIERRAEISSQHFDVSLAELLEALGDIEDFLLEGEGFAFSEDQIRSHFGREVISYFQDKLRDSGISQSHAHNLVLGVAHELAATDYKRESPEWWDAHIEFLHKLHKKIG